MAVSYEVYWASLVAWRCRIHLQCRRPWFDSWVQKISWDGIGYPLQYSQASLVTQMIKKICRQCRRCEFNPWVGKIPWMMAWQPPPVFLPGEPRGYMSQSTGSQRVGQNWVTEQSTAQHAGYCQGPGGSDGKESPCNAEDLGLTPGLGRSPEEGNGNLLPYSCFENPMDRGAWRAIVYRVTRRQTWLMD